MVFIKLKYWPRIIVSDFCWPTLSIFIRWFVGTYIDHIILTNISSNGIVKIYIYYYTVPLTSVVVAIFLRAHGLLIQKYARVEIWKTHSVDRREIVRISVRLHDYSTFFLRIFSRSSLRLVKTTIIIIIIYYNCDEKKKNTDRNWRRQGRTERWIEKNRYDGNILLL